MASPRSGTKGGGVMDALATTDAHLIRADLISLREWINHWKGVALRDQPCTQSSLILAQSHVDNALAVLDRMQAEQKAAA